MTNENTKLWDSVCTTDEQYVKQVKRRGGFTAIDAQYQFHAATEVFGRFGTGWGIENEIITPLYNGKVLLYSAILFYVFDEKRGQFPISTCAKLVDKEEKVDDDVVKKLSTDAITKGLSRLGFNADVFLRRFDDNRYVGRQNDSNTASFSESNTNTQGEWKNSGERQNLDDSVVWFGKHKGVAWAELDMGYLQWISKNMDGKPKDIADKELGLRKNPNQNEESDQFSDEVPF